MSIFDLAKAKGMGQISERDLSQLRKVAPVGKMTQSALDMGRAPLAYMGNIDRNTLLRTHPSNLTGFQLDALQKMINEDEEFAKAYRNATDYDMPRGDLNFYGDGQRF